MPPTSQVIVVFVLAAVVLASRCLLVWHALASAGRSDEARRRVTRLSVIGVLLVALAYYGGSLVGFDLMAFHARAVAGEASWERFYMACACTGLGAVLLVFFVRASSGVASHTP